MHNQEENGVAVITVASNKISKERGKTMKNEKTNLNIRKIKKQVKGITLIALVVTIVVMLILAGVALRATIGEGGLLGSVRNTVGQYQNVTEQEQKDQNSFVDAFNELLNGSGTPRRYHRKCKYSRKANNKYCRLE